jgi:hypothetical protein
MEPEIDMAFTSTETHTNIILNQRFSRADFIPSFTTGAIFDN